jgi:hypothetical protein
MEDGLVGQLCLTASLGRLTSHELVNPGEDALGTSASSS